MGAEVPQTHFFLLSLEAVNFIQSKTRTLSASNGHTFHFRMASYANVTAIHPVTLGQRAIKGKKSLETTSRMEMIVERLLGIYCKASGRFDGTSGGRNNSW